EVHGTTTRAAKLLGIGTSNILVLPSDSAAQLAPDVLRDALDREPGRPTIVVLQAGDVNCGAFDPFSELIPLAHDAGAWVHIDGAMGLWCNAVPELRHLLLGAELADSWATDGHKWLNAGYDSGIAVCARGEDLTRAFATDAAYLPSEDDRAPMHLSVQMSQRARGVEVWAVYASRGRRGIADLVEGCCRHAARLAARLADGGAEVLAPVVLNQALVAFGDDATTDAVIAALQVEGTTWAGPTTWHGHRALRLSVSDAATTDDDVDRVAAAVLRCHRRAG
ncbi:MAG TPA: pyridoxal-dependent decarboxylase, partial [Acidimicrobiales bacterium]|nr:pyridoxal-dependent decarboxylase [Acidimicrobiales bacterium]